MTGNSYQQLWSQKTIVQHLYCIEKREKPSNPEIHTFLRKRKKNCCTCLFCPLLHKTMLPSHLADEIHTPSRGCDDMCSLHIHSPSLPLKFAWYKPLVSCTHNAALYLCTFTSSIFPSSIPEHILPSWVFERVGLLLICSYDNAMLKKCQMMPVPLPHTKGQAEVKKHLSSVFVVYLCPSYWLLYPSNCGNCLVTYVILPLAHKLS